MKSQGEVIIFEGIDNVGKSTLANKLFEKTKSEQGDVVLYSYPGKENGTLGKVIYKIHHDPSGYEINSINPLSMQILHIAAHVDLLETKLLPDYMAGKTIILDRYWWSTIAYGIGDDIDEDCLWKITEIERSLTNKIDNKVFFYIKRDSDSGYSDYKRKKIINAYEKLFSCNKEGRQYTIENNGDIDKVLETIVDAIRTE